MTVTVTVTVTVPVTVTVTVATATVYFVTRHLSCVTENMKFVQHFFDDTTEYKYNFCLFTLRVHMRW